MVHRPTVRLDVLAQALLAPIERGLVRYDGPLDVLGERCGSVRSQCRLDDVNHQVKVRLIREVIWVDGRCGERVGRRDMHSAAREWVREGAEQRGVLLAGFRRGRVWHGLSSRELEKPGGEGSAGEGDDRSEDLLGVGLVFLAEKPLLDSVLLLEAGLQRGNGVGENFSGASVVFP